MLERHRRTREPGTGICANYLWTSHDSSGLANYSMEIIWKNAIRVTSYPKTDKTLGLALYEGCCCVPSPALSAQSFGVPEPIDRTEKRPINERSRLQDKDGTFNQKGEEV